MKKNIDEKKFELETRILAVLTEVFQNDAQSGHHDPDYWGIIGKDDLYSRVKANEFGHAGIFNGVLSSLAKAILIKENANVVRLTGMKQSEASQNLIDKLNLLEGPQPKPGAAFLSLVTLLRKHRNGNS
jgi:hypothetical protein